MRQPIVITDSDIKKMEENKDVNIKEAFENIRQDKITWGSDRNRLNNYICPSIWCIKDNVVIKPLQLVDNNFKCPICQGEL